VHPYVRSVPSSYFSRAVCSPSRLLFHRAGILASVCVLAPPFVLHRPFCVCGLLLLERRSLVGMYLGLYRRCCCRSIPRAIAWNLQSFPRPASVHRLTSPVMQGISGGSFAAELSRGTKRRRNGELRVAGCFGEQARRGSWQRYCSNALPPSVISASPTELLRAADWFIQRFVGLHDVRVPILTSVDR